MTRLTSLLTTAATAATFLGATFGFVLVAESQDKKARQQDPAAIVVEYFCCDADGTCLPANKNSVCPGGYTKVVNKTCEKGERGCDL